MSSKKGLFDQRIIELRKAKNMSQSDLAKKVGLSYTLVGRYETKGVQPPAEILKKMADALGTTVDYIISGASDEKAKASLKDESCSTSLKPWKPCLNATRLLLNL